MNLYFLVYTSTPVKQFSDAELNELLFKARRGNRERNITGLLLCLQGMFIQLIEGSEDQVKELYKKICEDSRHIDIEVLKQGPSTERVFPHWWMGFEKKEYSNPEHFVSEADWQQQVVKLFHSLDTL